MLTKYQSLLFDLYPLYNITATHFTIQHKMLLQNVVLEINAIEIYNIIKVINPLLHRVAQEQHLTEISILK